MNTKENNGAKYSEMIIEMVNTFKEQLSEQYEFDDVTKLAIEAWNLANNKESLGEKVYQNEIKGHKLINVLNEMVEFKLKHFAEHTNVIVDFSMVDDRLQIKSKKPEDLFNDLLKVMVSTKPEKKEKQ